MSGRRALIASRFQVSCRSIPGARSSAPRERIDMAVRPFAFSVRLRDRDKGRTLKVRNDPKNPRRYLIEDERAGEKTRVRSHENAAAAVRDAASTWRKRLH